VQVTFVKPTARLVVPNTPASLEKSTDTVPAHLDLLDVNSLASTAKVVTRGLPEAHLQLGLVTFINARPHSTDTADRSGSAWTQSPTQLEMSQFDPFANFNSYITGFHQSRAIE